jgi:hypothetical protein
MFTVKSDTNVDEYNLTPKEIKEGLLKRIEDMPDDEWVEACDIVDSVLED